MDNDKGHNRNFSKKSIHVAIKQDNSLSDSEDQSIDFDFDLNIPNIPNEQEISNIPNNRLNEEIQRYSINNAGDKANNRPATIAIDIPIQKNEKNLEITEQSLNNTLPEHNILLRKLSDKVEKNRKNLSEANLKPNLQYNSENSNPSSDQLQIIEYQTPREEDRVEMKVNILPSRQMIEMNNYATNDYMYNNLRYSELNFDEIDQLLGTLVVDVDKGLLVNENEFEGADNQDLGDIEVIKKLEEEMDHFHPRRELDNGQLVKFNPCSTTTGNMLCCENLSKSKLDSLGLGTVVYFRILKSLAIAFFLMILLNLPLYYVYPTNHTEFVATDYKDALFKTTLGNIGSSLTNCQKIPVASIFNTSSYTFSLNCNIYNISSVTMFGLSSNYNETTDNLMSCQNYSTYVNITANSQCTFTDYLNTYVVDNCLNMQQCEFEVDVTGIQNNCTSFPKYNDFFLTYNCFDNWVYMADIPVERSTFSFIVVGVDVASMFVLLITLFIIPISQKRIDKYFKKKIVGINDYTINFQNLGFTQEKLAEDLDSFLKHLNTVYKIENHDEKREDIIYDINYPLIVDKKLHLIIQRNKITQSLKKEQQLLNSKGKKHSEKQMVKLLNKIDELYKEEDTIKQKLIDVNSNELKCVEDLYVTFINQKFRDKIFKSYNRNCFRRCCIISFCQKKRIQHLYYKNKWLQMQHYTDSPSNILWQNVPYSELRRFGRKLLAVIVACFLILSSFAVVIGTKYAQLAINQSFNSNVDCSFIQYTQQDVIAEYNDSAIAERSKVCTYCFCRAALVSEGIRATKSITLDGTNIQPCQDWLKLYLYSESLTTATLIIVPVINILLDLLLRILTNSERNKTVSINSHSKMWKSFFLQLINTGIVILLVNINITKVQSWNPDFPLFTGLYNDLDPRWYQGVGVTILFCMMIYIFSPHIAPILYFLWVKVLRGCDRCCTRGRNTKKVTYRDYYNLYLGPEFDIGTRYSQILVTMFIVLIYSPGMPILYICCFLFLSVTYWVDKCLLLRFYRSPPHIDLFVAKLFDIILLFGMILHFCFAIWTYGNTSILVSTSVNVLQQIANWIKNEFQFQPNSFGMMVLDKITYSHNLICFIFLCFLVLIFLWRLFLSEILVFMVCFCRRKKMFKKVRDDSIYDAIGLKSLYMNHQLRKAQYFKVQTMPYSKNLIKSYFQRMIIIDREQILKKYERLTNTKCNCNIKTFDEEMPRIMKELKINEKPVIRNNVSYNIAYIPEFRDVVYFELILPYLKKKE